jgi:arylsulfatase A-like enzyme
MALATLLGGCGEPARDAAEEHERPLNVLLISIDSLRADHLGSYGYGRQTSPALDALAARGVLFENAVSQAPWTLPSHASLFTSQYSPTHQTTDPSRRLPAHLPTLASLLGEAGYSTHAVVGGTFMQAHFGLDSGFQIYDDELARVSHKQSHSEVTSPTTNAKAIEFLDQVEGPFFLFVHYWDVHYDLIPPPPYDRRFDPDYAGDLSSEDFMRNPRIRADMPARDLEHLLALYDGEVAWVDQHVGELLAALEARGLARDTVVVLTADHGDEFFEHGEKGHQHSLYQELLHVPLIVRVPGLPARRVSQAAELVDVLPTLLDLLELEPPAGLRGRSLRALLEGGVLEPRPSFAATTKMQKDRSQPQKSGAVCVVDGQQKLIVFQDERYPPELYDLRLDPGETRNLAGSRPHKRLSALVRRWIEDTPATAPATHGGLDEQTRAELRALGYLGDE